MLARICADKRLAGCPHEGTRWGGAAGVAEAVLVYQGASRGCVSLQVKRKSSVQLRVGGVGLVAGGQGKDGGSWARWADEEPYRTVKVPSQYRRTCRRTTVFKRWCLLEPRRC